MSHFTVLVIGEHPERQLAPYDENMDAPEYMSGVVSDEEKVSFMDYYREKYPTKILPHDGMEEIYAQYGEDWNSGSWRQDENDPHIWREYSTYNPKSKWDWYQLGGRWRGYFKLKPNGSGVVGDAGAFDNESKPDGADQVRKGDIDFAGMRADASEKAGKDWDAFHKIVAGREIPDWGEIRNKYPEDDLDKARAEYNSNPVTVDLEKSKEFRGAFFMDDPRDFCVSREEYCNRAAIEAISTFAVVKDGEWYEKGKMGWWAMVSNEKERGAWEKEFADLVMNLPDDTLLSLFDCHI